jgi:pilus assembly protein Flp/PilA
MSIKERLFTFIRDEEGLTTVEYAIAGGLVGAGVITAFALLGDQVFRIIDLIRAALTNVTIVP